MSDESARRWREDLESWAIPPEILAAAPETPWRCPTELFARSAREAASTDGGLTADGRRSPSGHPAPQALPHRGTLLHGGGGGGAGRPPPSPTAAPRTAPRPKPPQ